MTDITMTDILAISALGFVSVFLVLSLIMVFIMGMNKIFDLTSRRKATKPASYAAVPKSVQEAEGSCGDIKLYNVPDREAAMIMAIVADELKTPINEIRFISIRETGREKQERSKKRSRGNADGKESVS